MNKAVFRFHGAQITIGVFTGAFLLQQMQNDLLLSKGIRRVSAQKGDKTFFEAGSKRGNKTYY